jgi:hypothetical protein
MYFHVVQNKTALNIDRMKDPIPAKKRIIQGILVTSLNIDTPNAPYNKKVQKNHGS